MLIAERKAEVVWERTPARGKGSLSSGSAAALDGLAVTEGVEFLPGRTVSGRLLSLRRSRSHLFVRYAMEAAVVPR